MTRPDLVAFIRKHRWGVEASVTATGQPQAAVVGVAVTDELELVFDTLGDTRKAANLRQPAAYACVRAIAQSRRAVLGDEIDMCAAFAESGCAARALEHNGVGIGRIQIRQFQFAAEARLHWSDRCDHGHCVLVVRDLVDRLAARDAGFEDFRVVEGFPHALLWQRDELLAGHFHRNLHEK